MTIKWMAAVRVKTSQQRIHRHAGCAEEQVHLHCSWCHLHPEYHQHHPVTIGLLKVSKSKVCHPSRWIYIHHFPTRTVLMLMHTPRIMWEPVRNLQFGSMSRLVPNWNHCDRLYPSKELNCTEPVVLWPVPQFREFRTIARMRYSSADCTTVQYIRIWCSFAYCSTSSAPNWDPINIRWVTVKNAHFLELFHRNSTNIDWIVNWRKGAESAWKTASYTYISYCDTIRTQIVNWSLSFLFAKMKLCYMHHVAKMPRN